MYKALLIFKYLRKRRIAWISLIAVMLCTAMVLVVISVMGGWLRMFRQTSHALVGDLVVYRISLDGFPHYQEMIDQIEALPEVKAASPQIHTYGLVNIIDQIRTGVEVEGYDIKKIGQINGFVNSLHLQKSELEAKAADMEQEAKTASAEDAALLLADAKAMRAKAATFPSWDKPLSADSYRDVLPASRVDVANWPGMIVGSGVVGIAPDDKGVVKRSDIMYHAWVRLTILNISQGEDIQADSRAIRSYWLIDDSHTGIYQIDQNTVYVPFDLLQKDLNMDAQSYTDATTGEKREQPARCDEIEIGLKDGFDPNLVKPKIEKIVSDMTQKYDDLTFRYDPITTETWEERQADFLSAVEHEKSLLVILFAIISVVAVFLIFCIFFMIVVEKTRDIGIIKSVGATGAGVMAIFLGYGLAIGMLGGGLGLLLGYLIIHNINELHAWMSRELGVTVWNAKTYVFDTIPNTMETRDVVVIVTIAVLSAVVGALVPAIRAARMNPVEALRWE
jgi:lipoprotein-releasing system permease protein